MSSEIEHIEYDRDINPYPSFGKKYNGEKAIISMTSWKMRIATCSKTIYSLLKQCPGFHIVLVLSEEEFPKMMDELPADLKMFAENELIEILWVYKNYKSFKKVLFTMDKYRDVPVISADDGCVYKENYAQQLFDIWKNHKTEIVSRVHFQNSGIDFGGGGYGILYPPQVFANCTRFLKNDVINQNHDDSFMGVLSKFLNIKWIYQNRLRNYPQSYINIQDMEIVGLFKTGKYNKNSTSYFKRLFRLP